MCKKSKTRSYSWKLKSMFFFFFFGFSFCIWKANFEGSLENKVMVFLGVKRDNLIYIVGNTTLLHYMVYTLFLIILFNFSFFYIDLQSWTIKEIKFYFLFQSLWF